MSYYATQSLHGEDMITKKEFDAVLDILRDMECHDILDDICVGLMAGWVDSNGDLLTDATPSLETLEPPTNAIN